MIKNFVCMFLIATVATVTFADLSIEEDILSRCKHVQCKNVADLKLEALVRQCVKTTCTSSHLTRTLKQECEKGCIDEIKNQPQDDKRASAKILDYDWMN